MVQAEHRPVMLAEVLETLRPRDGGRYIDLTLGLGGHAEALLERSSPRGQVLGIDRDAEALKLAGERLRRFGPRLIVVHGPFADLPRHLEKAGWRQADGMLADLGVSSWQLQDAGRGFGFQSNGPLDMRMDTSRGETLAQKLSGADAEQLAGVLARFGQVRAPRLLARRIMEALRQGKLAHTGDLARIAGEPGRRGSLHPATRVFQALRIWVNEELEQLQRLLDYLPEPLAPGGRVAIISFHSLEDRLVKQRFRSLAGECDCPPALGLCRCRENAQARLLARRALRPAEEEVRQNPRARSARLRALERLAA